MQGDKSRKRMVVEEVPDTVNTEPVEEIKEKVEELQTLTETISETVEKSADVQEEIAQAVEDVLPETPSEVSFTTSNIVPEIKNSSGPNPLVIIIPGIFLLGALLGGIYFYQKSISSNPATSTPPAIPDYTNTITPAPSLAPSAKLDLTKYPINVMNGSGTTGQAGVVKSLLTKAGFSVSSTGNASSYDFTKTVIKAKSDVPKEFLTQLSTLLSKSYVLDTNEALATSSADTVQIIIGSTKTP